MIVEIHYIVSKEGGTYSDCEMFDFSELDNPPEVGNVIWRFHQRMQLKKKKIRLNEKWKTEYARNLSPDEYEIHKVEVYVKHRNYSGVRCYRRDELGDNPTVTRKAKPQAPQQSELNV